MNELSVSTLGNVDRFSPDSTLTDMYKSLVELDEWASFGHYFMDLYEQSMNPYPLYHPRYAILLFWTICTSPPPM